MKKFVFAITSLCIWSSSYGQRLDSLATIEDLRLAIIHMNENLELSHRQFNKGLKVSVVGVAVLSIAIAVIQPNSDLQLIVGFQGAACTILGLTIMIDSHKYIGRAGRWKFLNDSNIVRK